MGPVLLTLLLASPSPEAPPEEAALRAAVECVMDAWNAYDVEASRKCYAADAVARHAHGVVPIDWEMESRLRSFDRVVRSRFRAEIRRTDGSAIEYRLTETNEFLEALGLESVSALWRYVVRDGRIAQEEHLDADPSFQASLRRFTRWGTTNQPAGWKA